MSIVTVGDFDGVHIGHKLLLRQVVTEAALRGEPSVVITFDKNTKTALKKYPLAYLTDSEEKKNLLLAEGIDRVQVVSFDDAFSGMTASEFLFYLKSEYNCTHLFGGEDFHFGWGGKGILTDGAVVDGICQHVVSLKTDLMKISSSAIRAALTDGLIERANTWLGYSYSISGTVVEGLHLGRTIGFPTVNMRIDQGKALPKNGVYITETVVDGKRCRSITNIGVRPTVSEGSLRNMETHILYAEGDYYGKKITVRFLARLRDEMKFPNLGALMQQLRIDRDMAFSWHSLEHF